MDKNTETVIMEDFEGDTLLAEEEEEGMWVKVCDLSI